MIMPQTSDAKYLGYICYFILSATIKMDVIPKPVPFQNKPILAVVLLPMLAYEPFASRMATSTTHNWRATLL